MTHSASEIFTMQLARAAAKQAGRFLRARGLQKADRDDVIAAAMLWCWSHRAEYSLTTTLETWFMNAVRDAYKDLQRNALPSSGESLDHMGGGDETYNIAAAESAATVLLSAMRQSDKAIAILVLQGYTRSEIMARGISKRSIDEANQRIKQLRKLLPDAEGVRLISRTMPPVSSDDTEDKLSEIDVALEDLDSPPPHGKECPPCIHCNWWEYRYRVAESPQVEATSDAEVIEAQRAILARKIEISSRVEQ